MKKPIAKNTERSHQWAGPLMYFKIGYSCRGRVTFTNKDLWSEEADKVCLMFCKFIAEARQSNRKPYTPKTIMANLQSL